MKRKLIAGLLVTACASSIANASMLDTGIRSNDSVIFNFAGLSEHAEVKLNFDLFIMDSWDGSAEKYAGPDVFGFRIGNAEYSWSFRNASQDPGDESNIDSTWETGNFNSINTSGEIDRKFVDYADGFTVSHTGSSVNVEFFGSGLQEITDESWRVNNISLTAVPVPTAVWLFASGLFGLAGMRRKIS